MACIVQMHVAPGFRAVDTSGELVVPDGNMDGYWRVVLGWLWQTLVEVD